MKELQLEFKTRNPKQVEAAEAWLDPIIEEILYGGGKGGAKSYTGVSLIFGSAHTYPKTNWFIARKELIDLKRYTIPSIHEVHENWGLKIEKYLKFDGQLSIFTLPNGSKVHLISCADIPSDPMFERFGSMQMTGGWIEEAGEVPEAAKNNLRLSIGRWKNELYGLPAKLFITANPKKGWMKRDFVDPHHEGKLPKTRKYIQALASDNPYLPQSYQNTLHAIKDKTTRERLAEGNWDYEDDKDSLFDSDALSDTFSNTIVKDGEKYMTVDVARKGRDSTVLSFWEGLELYKVKIYQKQGTDKTEQQIKDDAAAEKIPYSHILVDEDGIGGGVVDHLLGVKGFIAKSRPIPTKNQIIEKKKKLNHSLAPTVVFSGLKSQCGWKLAELINDHKIAFKVPELRDVIIEQLTAILRDKEPDGDGSKQLKPKKKVKEDLGGKSPDVGDTILMRAYFELKRESTGAYDESKSQTVEEQKISFARNRKNQSVNSSK